MSENNLSEDSLMRPEVSYNKGFAAVDYNFETKLVVFSTDNPGLARRIHGRLVKLGYVNYRFPINNEEWLYQVPMLCIKNPVHLIRGGWD